MFLTSRDEDKKFEVFPEVVLKGPIYSTAAKYERYNLRYYNSERNWEIYNLKGNLQV